MTNVVIGHSDAGIRIATEAIYFEINESLPLITMLLMKANFFIEMKNLIRNFVQSVWDAWMIHGAFWFRYRLFFNWKHDVRIKYADTKMCVKIHWMHVIRMLNLRPNFIDDQIHLQPIM